MTITDAITAAELEPERPAAEPETRSGTADVHAFPGLSPQLSGRRCTAGACTADPGSWLGKPGGGAGGIIGTGTASISLHRHFANTRRHVNSILVSTDCDTSGARHIVLSTRTGGPARDRRATEVTRTDLAATVGSVTGELRASPLARSATDPTPAWDAAPTVTLPTVAARSVRVTSVARRSQAGASAKNNVPCPRGVAIGGHEDAVHVTTGVGEVTVQ